MVIAQLRSSSFFGGPERQMLGLARSLPETDRSVFLLFDERGRYRPFLDEIQRYGHEAVVLEHNMPRIRLVVHELAKRLRQDQVDVLTCADYKANLLGYLAARKAGIPVVAVAHGWTAESAKVRVYETIDRLCMRWMDRVVCVSEGQAVKVRRAGVPAERVVVIRNAIFAEAFRDPDPAYAEQLRALFPTPPRRIVGAAGRLSPEKGFGVMVEAAAIVVQTDPSVNFVLFGDGPLRDDLARRIEALKLKDRFVLAGFRSDVIRFLPHLDLAVLPSFTEGLPVIALEAYASGVPVVATAVGGTPEVVDDGKDGLLVPPGDPNALARSILNLVQDDGRRRSMGRQGRNRIREQFTFDVQATLYRQLFEELRKQPRTKPTRGQTSLPSDSLPHGISR